MKEEVVSPAQQQRSHPSASPSPALTFFSPPHPPLPAPPLKCSQTLEHADLKRCSLVTALFCQEVHPPPLLGSMGVSWPWGGAPAPSGHAGVCLGTCLAELARSRAALGAVPGLQRCAMSPATLGVLQAAPQCPLCSWQCTPAALRGAARTPDTDGTRLWCLAGNQPAAGVPNSETVPGGGGASYARRVRSQESSAARGERPSSL